MNLKIHKNTTNKQAATIPNNPTTKMFITYLYVIVEAPNDLNNFIFESL